MSLHCGCGVFCSVGCAFLSSGIAGDGRMQMWQTIAYPIGNAFYLRFLRSNLFSGVSLSFRNLSSMSCDHPAKALMTPTKLTSLPEPWATQYGRC